MTDTRIFLSPPDVSEVERKLLLEAFDSNWVAPVGPDLDAFETQVAELVGVRHAMASVGSVDFQGWRKMESA